MSGLGRLGLGLRNFGRRGSSIGGSPAVTTSLALGMNSNLPGYSSNQQTFTDLVHGQAIQYWDTTLNSGAGGWVSEVPAAYLDANGWPTSMPPNATQFDLAFMVPDTSGPYKVTWDDPNAKGTGIGLLGATGTQSGNSITFTSLTQPLANGVHIRWSIAAGGGYPSNFKCRPVTDDGSVAAPNAKARLQAMAPNGNEPFRFMHLTNVEANRMTNPTGNWDTKFPVNGDGQLLDPIFTSTTRNMGPLSWWDGISLEDIVAFATAINRPFQWSAPWNCDTSYLAQAASQMAAFAVATGKKVYVARSNEVWNFQYHVASQCLNEANYHATLGTKTACRVVATGNITLSGTQTIDGVAVVAGDRVLCAGQTTASQNGVYVVAAGAWSRAADTIATGDEWFISAGTTNAVRTFRVRTTGTITVGTTALSITRFQNYERYAEKAKELFDAFTTAFTSAGVIDKLECVLEWQHSNTPTSVWDAMRAIATNATAISTAPYVGQNTGGEMLAAGYGTGYVGPISAIWPSAKANCDSTLAFLSAHYAYAQANGLKQIVYEMGPQIGFTDVTTFTNFVHDIGNYDYVQYLLQEVEKINPNLVGSLFQFVQRTQNSSGAAFSPQTTYWGFLEGTYQTPGANTPKYNALVDFYAGKRSPQALAGTIAYAPNPVNGQQVGTLGRWIKGATRTFISGGAGLAESNGVITITDHTLVPTSSGSVTIRETHPGFPSPGYLDTVVPLTVQTSFVTTTGHDKNANVGLSNNNLTATELNNVFNASARMNRSTSGQTQWEATPTGSVSQYLVGFDDGTPDFTTTSTLPGYSSSGFAVLMKDTSIDVRLNGVSKFSNNTFSAGWATGRTISLQRDDSAGTVKVITTAGGVSTVHATVTGVSATYNRAFASVSSHGVLTANIGGSAFAYVDATYGAY
jgi:hypothetical protein